MIDGFSEQLGVLGKEIAFGIARCRRLKCISEDVNASLEERESARRLFGECSFLVECQKREYFRLKEEVSSC